jgi:hypothetical protein
MLNMNKQIKTWLLTIQRLFSKHTQKFPVHYTIHFNGYMAFQNYFTHIYYLLLHQFITWCDPPLRTYWIKFTCLFSQLNLLSEFSVVAMLVSSVGMHVTYMQNKFTSYIGSGISHLPQSQWHNSTFSQCCVIHASLLLTIHGHLDLTLLSLPL